MHMKEDITVEQWSLVFNYDMHNRKSSNDGKEEYNGMLVLMTGAIKYPLSYSALESLQIETVVFAQREYQVSVTNRLDYLYTIVLCNGPPGTTMSRVPLLCSLTSETKEMRFKLRD